MYSSAVYSCKSLLLSNVSLLLIQASDEGVKGQGQSRPYEQDPYAEAKRGLTCTVTCDLCQEVD